MSETIEISVPLYTQLVQDKFVLESVRAYLSSNEYTSADEIRLFLAALGIDARYRKGEDVWPDESEPEESGMKPQNG